MSIVFASAKQHIETLDELIAGLQAIRQEIGTGAVQINISVFHEGKVQHADFYEDRDLASMIEHVKKSDGTSFVELYV